MYESDSNKDRIAIRNEFADIVKKLCCIADINPMINVFIYGGFVRDGENWAADDGDIDIAFKTCELTKYNKFFVDSMIEQFRTYLKEFHQCQETLIKNSKYSVARYLYQYKGESISIDFSDKQDVVLKTDFDVNTLIYDAKKGIYVNKNYDHLSFCNIQENIRKKVFNVLWQEDWTTNDINNINQRISKMESRGWKCLNKRN